MKNIEIIESIDSQGRPTILVNGVDVCDKNSGDSYQDYEAAVMLAYKCGEGIGTNLESTSLSENGSYHPQYAPAWNWGKSHYRITRPKAWEPIFPDGADKWEKVEDLSYNVGKGDFAVQRASRHYNLIHMVSGCDMSAWIKCGYEVYRRKPVAPKEEKKWEPTFPGNKDDWAEVTEGRIKGGDFLVNRADRSSMVTRDGSMTIDTSYMFIKEWTQAFKNSSVYRRKSLIARPVSREAWEKAIISGRIWWRHKGAVGKERDFYPIDSCRVITNMIEKADSREWSMDLIRWFPCTGQALGC